MEQKEDIEVVRIFAGSILQAEMLKNLLENEGIESYLLDELSGTYFPFLTSAGGSGPVSVAVSSLDYDKAKAIVNEYEKNLKS
ncbi:MAG: DUF2007 domain-containing protein [Bacteroidales bacterium]|nr:DUF2007 domain-containing protein [Bacteroidales bacterium]